MKVQNVGECLSGWCFLNRRIFCYQIWYGDVASWTRVPCKKKQQQPFVVVVAIFKVKVTARVHMIKIWLFLLYFLNCWFPILGKQTWSDDTLSEARVSCEKKLITAFRVKVIAKGQNVDGFVQMISPKPSNILFPNLVLWCIIMSQSVMQKDWLAIFKVKITVRVQNLIKSLCLTLQPIMMHHNTKFGNKILAGLEDIIWTILTFWPFTVTLTLNAVNQFFSQDTLAYNDVSSDQVWIPRNQQFRKHSRKSYILIIWALAVTLLLKIAHTKKSASHSGSWCCIIVPSLPIECSVIQKISSEDVVTEISPHCDLDIEHTEQFFLHGTLVMMLHHHTRYGYKTFLGSEEIIWTNIHWHLEPLLWPWPWTQ